MNYVGKLFSGFRGFYNEINSATLTGAIDIVVVEQENGDLVCSPFHVRFGKMGVLRAREKVVDISVNGIVILDVHMKLGEAGEAFFVEELDEPVDIPLHLVTSPLPSYEELMGKGVEELRQKCKNDVKRKSSAIERPVSPPPDVDLARRLSDNALMTSSTNSAVMTASTPLVGSASAIYVSALEVNTSNDFQPIKGGSAYPLSPKPSRLEFLSNTGLADDDSDCSGPTADRTKKRHSHRSLKKRKYRAKAKEMTKSDEVTPEAAEAEGGVFDMEMMSADDDVTPTVAHASLPSAEENRMDRTGEWASTTQFTSAFFPFSDGDLTPVASPSTSRPQSPKSDSEFERVRQVQSRTAVVDGDDECDVRWPWGELPDQSVIAKVRGVGTHQNVVSERKNSVQADSKNDLMKFLKANQKRQQRPVEPAQVSTIPDIGGMYLDQLGKEDLDPELAALYLYQARSSSHQLRPVQKDEDCESGRGASLPMSPVSIEGAKSDNEGEPDKHLDDDHCTDVSMSLCGGLMDDQGKISKELFMQSLVTYDDFVQNPDIITNPDLVVKVGGKFYNWQVAGPFILSLCVFQRPLPVVALESLMKNYMPKKDTRKRGYTSWFSWRRAAPQDVASSSSSSAVLVPATTATITGGAGSMSGVLTTVGSVSSTTATTSTTADVADASAPVVVDIDKSKMTELTCDVSSLSSPSSTPPRTPAVSSPNKKDEETSSEAETESSDKESNLPKYHHHSTHDKFKKTVRLTCQQLESLHLHEGRNEVTFSVTTALQGTTRCTSHIYKWRYDDKIIVSDIDGTITKSDVLGQILPMVGKDWSQTGVAQLYSKIARNGYKFLYLSARAIGQSTITRDYLRSIRQGELMLPDGPLLLTPSSLISAFHREVIERNPEEFKISCLRDIGALFPGETNPFYAGFGNKINDVWAYRATGIPTSRIFTINHRGELRHELTHTFQSSYTSLSDVSDHIFPSLCSRSRNAKLYAPDSYSTFTYWRESLPEIQVDISQFNAK